ncbi:MAG: hypothetical protein ABSC06_29235 [Rhodopila sp.]
MRTAITLLVGATLLAGCSDLNNTQQRALTGTVGGAGVGAVLGAIGRGRPYPLKDARADRPAAGSFAAPDFPQAMDPQPAR